MEELEWSGVGHRFIREGDVELRYATLGEHVDLVMRGQSTDLWTCSIQLDHIKVGPGQINDSTLNQGN